MIEEPFDGFIIDSLSLSKLILSSILFILLPFVFNRIGTSKVDPSTKDPVLGEKDISALGTNFEASIFEF
jgi:hypothetical protein